MEGSKSTDSSCDDKGAKLPLLSKRETQEYFDAMDELKKMRPTSFGKRIVSFWKSWGS